MPTPQHAAQAAAIPARDVYFSLSGPASAQPGRELAQRFLAGQIDCARHLADELPARAADLAEWLHRREQAVGGQYRDYLAARKGGAARRYFSCKAHALYFLKSVAPTKLVDGAWLYGLLERWRDDSFRDLIRTYLEELGDGIAENNHVTIYKALLAAHGCEQWDSLADEHFVQGAIQLCFAHGADDFLPELIGYNLGYEQLPLHLLITAYELNELGIDPYYFTLHVTIDNAASGHAKRALNALAQSMPQLGDNAAFFRRVKDGYRLNDLGQGTTSVIAGFDLERELVAMLAAKSTTGRNLHSDYCRVAGRTVNDWLSDPRGIPDFLRSLEQAGWIKRGEPAANSRFWRLVHGERADMFGVFTDYEQQLLHDWIEGADADGARAGLARPITFRARSRKLNVAGGVATPARPPRPLLRHVDGVAASGNELREFDRHLASLDGKDEVMAALRAWMSPASHHTPLGLMATRIFSRLAMQA